MERWCAQRCCFFFKQKTAYEMRISDWSSDVCSSDLRTRCHERPPTSCRRPRRGCSTPSPVTGNKVLTQSAGRDRMTSKLFDFTGADGQHLSGRLDVPEGPVLAYALFAHCLPCIKIGRASCRERVCQYV